MNNRTDRSGRAPLCDRGHACLAWNVGHCSPCPWYIRAWNEGIDLNRKKIKGNLFDLQWSTYQLHQRFWTGRLDGSKRMVLNHRSKNGVSRIIDQKMELADASHTRRRPDAGVDIFQPPPPLVTMKSRWADKTHRLVKRADWTDEGTWRRATMSVSPTRWIDLSAAKSRLGRETSGEIERVAAIGRRGWNRIYICEQISIGQIRSLRIINNSSNLFWKKIKTGTMGSDSRAVDAQSMPSVDQRWIGREYVLLGV